jgi:hypothetical protein
MADIITSLANLLQVIVVNTLRGLAIERLDAADIVYRLRVSYPNEQ